MEIPGGGGEQCEALWNVKSWGVGAQTGKKNLRGGGIDIFWNHNLYCSANYTGCNFHIINELHVLYENYCYLNILLIALVSQLMEF